MLFNIFVYEQDLSFEVIEYNLSEGTNCHVIDNEIDGC